MVSTFDIPISFFSKSVVLVVERIPRRTLEVGVEPNRLNFQVVVERIPPYCQVVVVEVE
jgi:hypothetical protein